MVSKEDSILKLKVSLDKRIGWTSKRSRNLLDAAKEKLEIEPEKTTGKHKQSKNSRKTNKADVQALQSN